MSQASAALAAEGEDAAPGAVVVPLSDRVLLERHVRGDRDAFAELIHMHGGSVYAYLARTGIPADERDDLFQEVFCKVHRALGRALPDAPVRPWLLSIAVNTVRDSFRKKKVRAVVHLDNAGDDRPDKRQHPPDESAQARETADFLSTEVAKLPLDQREVLLLCCVEGMSLEEVAEVVNVPINTVKTRLRRARLFLAEAMRRRGAVAQREGGAR